MDDEKRNCTDGKNEKTGTCAITIQKTPFEKSTYLSQVHRLRRLGQLALLQYKIQMQKMDFINHGENTTFKITAKNGKKFLLRIHRFGYHTQAAIQEELRWMQKISDKSDLILPMPVISKNQNSVEFVQTAEVPTGRCVCVFEWVDGTFIDKSISEKHLFQIGENIAVLQRNTLPMKSSHRKYWVADGLVGKNAKFGPVDSLNDASPKDQSLIVKNAALVHRKLKKFEKRFPERQCLIHADMHFGNVLKVGNKIGVIDFDDCGIGFKVYDLVIPYMSAENILKSKKQTELLPALKKALINGYSKTMPWDDHDEEIFHVLYKARKLKMLGWLNSRSDNPKLKKYLKKAIPEIVEFLKRN